MSKLEELIQEYCPNGVAYVALENVCMISKGIQINKKDMHDEGTYPVINGGINPSGYIEQYNQEEKTITISQGGASAGFVNWLDTKFWAGAHCYVLKPTNNILNRYLFHFVKSKEYKLQECQYGAGIPALAKSTVASLEIPVPPLDVQSEIVRILDNFTELTAELTARKKQYEYYRTKLLEHPENESQMVAVSDLGKWSGGKTPSTANKDFWEGGTIPWISSKDMKAPTLEDTEDHLTEKALTDGVMTLLPEGIVAIVTRSGILKHTFPVAYVPFRTTVNQDIKALVVKDGISSRYVFHALQAYAEDIRKSTKKQGGTVDSLDFQRLLTYKIPVPPLDVQNRLAHVLDNFEAICSDLNIGLPAENQRNGTRY